MGAFITNTCDIETSYNVGLKRIEMPTQISDSANCLGNKNDSVSVSSLR